MGSVYSYVVFNPAGTGGFAQKQGPAAHMGREPAQLHIVQQALTKRGHDTTYRKGDQTLGKPHRDGSVTRLSAAGTQNAREIEAKEGKMPSLTTIRANLGRRQWQRSGRSS